MRCAVVAASLMLAAAATERPAAAHHSFAVEFDAAKPVQLTGQVTKVEWLNPHARVYLDVTSEPDAVINWNIELGPPLILTRLGWRRDSLKIGDHVTIDGHLAKDGSKMANAETVRFSDGRILSAGSAD
jgi:hypothetical protein